MFRSLLSLFQKNTAQTQENNDFETNLKKLYANKELLELNFINAASRISSSQRFLLLSVGIGVLSNMSAWYAQLNLDWIGEEILNHQREILPGDDSYESMKFYSEIVNYLSHSITIGLLVKELLHYYYSDSYQNFKIKLSPHYLSLYKNAEDTIISISDNFNALSEDKKRSLTELIDQDDIQNIHLKFFCICKQGFVVHPIKVYSKGPNNTEYSEIYDACYFLTYLTTRLSALVKGSPLLTPTGSPILRCGFSVQLNQEHMKYWLTLQNKVNELSLDKVEAKPLALTPT